MRAGAGNPGEAPGHGLQARDELAPGSARRSTQAVSFGKRLDGDGAAFHWSPYVGATRDVGRWTFGAELRWWEPHTGSDVLAWWQGIGGRGALAPMISIARRMGADR